MKTMQVWENWKIPVCIWLLDGFSTGTEKNQTLSTVHTEPRIILMCDKLPDFPNFSAFLLLIFYVPKEEESSGCKIPGQRGSTHRR